MSNERDKLMKQIANTSTSDLMAMCEHLLAEYGPASQHFQAFYQAMSDEQRLEITRIVLDESAADPHTPLTKYDDGTYGWRQNVN